MRIVTNNAAYTGLVSALIFKSLPTLVADAAEYTLVAADQEKFLTRVDFNVFKPLGTGSTICIAESDDILRPYQSGDFDNGSFYVVLVATTAQTPASAQTFKVYADVN
jgi:hypothetical protein